MDNQLIPQEEFQTYTSLGGTTSDSQTESPSDSGILTTRTLDVTSISNNDLDSSYGLGDTSVITDYNTLLVYINELLIRFDASPKYYQKEDYRHLIKTIVDSLRYVYAEWEDPFVYEDFTPAQIAELQRPATDAVIALNEAEALRVTAETTRVENEVTRQENTNIVIQNTISATDSMLSNLISLEIRDDLCIWFETPETYSGITFDLQNGNLIATI